MTEFELNFALQYMMLGNGKEVQSSVICLACVNCPDQTQRLALNAILESCYDGGVSDDDLWDVCRYDFRQFVVVRVPFDNNISNILDKVKLRLEEIFKDRCVVSDVQWNNRVETIPSTDYKKVVSKLIEAQEENGVVEKNYLLNNPKRKKRQTGVSVGYIYALLAFFLVSEFFSLVWPPLVSLFANSSDQDMARPSFVC